MDKILVVLALVGVALGALLIPRTARGNVTVSFPEDNLDPDEPGFIPPSGVRGIRNNNPFNVRFRSDINWRGQIGVDDKGFVVTDSALNGLRMGMINIHTKMMRDGIRTVRGLVNVLSPPSENPTEAFVNFVAQRMNVSPEQPLNFESDIIPLSKAIVTFENASDPYPDSLYREALRETGKI